ncbi:Mcm10p ASCRUDRAFT_129137 [Ascoidea rubescens DSM 1968]|uniref:Uncharacterized protein n=1 Tax=Ascoidea rubescens DSM 1968 TaxID=1344418 RepID=A0A1D2V8S2_9ASCO|nr:hypothetical protein ASCRUDRAFT_129137 [Ascoidea rubescens DSM 1968]ODV58024.1 hypothetical protein ASCRUDRAFT_129137 [Ascoidea rubescens DSM 1968]
MSLGQNYNDKNEFSDNDYGILSDDEKDFVNPEERERLLKMKEEAMRLLNYANERLQSPLKTKKRNFNNSIGETKQANKFCTDEKTNNNNNNNGNDKNTKAINDKYRLKRKAHKIEKSQIAVKLQQSGILEKEEKKNKAEFLKQRVFTFIDQQTDICVQTNSVVNEKDKYSGSYLSLRYLGSDAIDKMLGNKAILRIDKLFGKVHYPDFKEPNYPNWVVVGIISNKAELKIASNNKKYLKISLTDFNLVLNLMLFDDACQKYWKLKVGDIIGVLNPKISPWVDNSKKVKTFNLVLNSKYDSILEIGKSRDFGICIFSNNKTGIKCNAPVNKSRTQYCYFHQDYKMQKSSSKRLELSGAMGTGAPIASRNNDGKQILMNRNYHTNNEKSYGLKLVDDPFAKEKVMNGDEGNNRLYFSNSHAKKAFFDDEYSNPEVLKKLAAKKQIQKNKNKELELRNKLVQIKGGESLRNLYETENEKLEKKKVMNVAFSPRTLSRLGFDPTKNAYDSSIGSSDAITLNAKESFELLESVRKKRRKIYLSPSKKAVIERKNQQEVIYQKSQAYIKGTIKSKESNPQRSTGSQDSRGTSRLLLRFQNAAPSSDSSSDSELDIDFGEKTQKSPHSYLGKPAR